MGILKGSIRGNAYIGAFATSTDDIVLLSHTATKNEETAIESTLDVKAVRCSISGSDLVGIYTVANANGILVPEIAEGYEIERIRKAFPGMNVQVLPGNLNALKNNILANDRIAIINPEYRNDEAKIIGDVLGVEVAKFSIGGFPTVGANNLITNKGLVLNNHASEEETARAKELMGNVSHSTANLGSSSIGLCAVANSKGLYIGNETTGFELARISQTLEID